MISVGMQSEKARRCRGMAGVAETVMLQGVGVDTQILQHINRLRYVRQPIPSLS